MTGYASYIGRVGALAVALGVGAAVAGGHGFAWADTTGSAASDASTTSSPAGGDTAAAGGDPVTAVDDSVPAGSPSAAAPKKPKKAPPKVVISNSGGAQNTSGPDRHAADQTPPADGQVITDASAAQPNTSAQQLADAAPDTAPSAPDTLAKNPGSTSRAEEAGPRRQPSSQPLSTPGGSSKNNTPASTYRAAATPPAAEVDAPLATDIGHAVSDAVKAAPRAAQHLAAAAPNVASVVVSHELTSLPAIDTASPQPDPTSPAPPLTASRTAVDVTSSVLATVLAPFANTAPTLPVGSPTMWTLAAFARREFEQTVNPSPTGNPLSGQITDGLLTDTAALDDQSVDPMITRNVSAPSLSLSDLTPLSAPGTVSNAVPTSAVTVTSPALMAPDVRPAFAMAQRPAAPTAAAPRDPVNSVAVAIWGVVSSLASPFADTPTAPVEPPAAWTLLAAARRETFGTSPTLGTVVNPPTNGLNTDADGASALAASVAPTQPSVVAIEQTPPLAWLQQLPVVGPVFVTPIVALIHQIPIISDILHPLIGYPVQMGLPAGTPVPRDVKVISFDGTQIYVHFMPAVGLQKDQRAPTILNGPGLPLPGATNLDGALFDDVITDAFGQVSIATLRQAGYNVVTWDPRGEYNSGGVLEIDSPDFEARDVSAIISWLATQPEVQLDGPPADLDPRIGMVGVSYGGGIQLVTAATDHRVDAIVPTIAWHTLNSSLYKNEAPKTGWGAILIVALLLTGDRVNPRIYPAALDGALTGTVTQADQDLLAARGPGGVRGFPDLVSRITAPTLLIQGTVDTLFTPQEADENAMTLIANGVPTKVLWFCGGHGICVNNLFDLSDGALIEQRTLEWLDRWVKHEDVDTGPQFEWVDQRGQYFSSNVYPVPPGNPIVASSSAGGVLPLLPFFGGSGPLLSVLPIGGTRATNAVSLTIPAATTTTYVVGAPQLTLTYAGIGLSRHVYAQLVDDTTGLVLGNQVTPVPVTLDGQTHTVSIPLEPVAHTLRPGETVTLQLVASAVTYETIWSLGELNVSSMQLRLPTVEAAAISPPSSVAELNVA